MTEPLEIAKPLEQKTKWDMEWKDGAFFWSTDYVTINVPEGCVQRKPFDVFFVCLGKSTQIVREEIYPFVRIQESFVYTSKSLSSGHEKGNFIFLFFVLCSKFEKNNLADIMLLIKVFWGGALGFVC